MRCEQLQRDIAVERKIAGTVDHAHSTAADEDLDPEAGELGANARVG
jgi:hypothetical protein